jgi:hypothetical protein
MWVFVSDDGRASYTELSLLLFGRPPSSGICEVSRERSVDAVDGIDDIGRATETDIVARPGTDVTTDAWWRSRGSRLNRPDPTTDVGTWISDGTWCWRRWCCAWCCM